MSINKMRTLLKSCVQKFRGQNEEGVSLQEGRNVGHIRNILYLY